MLHPTGSWGALGRVPVGSRVNVPQWIYMFKGWEQEGYISYIILFTNQEYCGLWAGRPMLPVIQQRSLLDAPARPLFFFAQIGFVAAGPFCTRLDLFVAAGPVCDRLKMTI